MIGIRVPLLLSVVDAVINRIDIDATRAVDPPGAESSGYDDAFREPVVYDEEHGASVQERVVVREELPAITVPCQVETQLFDNLAQAYQGNLQQGEMALVFHVKDLTTLGLIDVTTNKPLISVGDRVSALHKHNMPTIVALAISQEGMFIREVFPASWGFGDSYDLWIAVITNRDKASL